MLTGLWFFCLKPKILCKCCSFLGQGHISRPLGPLQVPFPVAHRPTPKSFKPTLTVDNPTPGLSSFFNRSRWSGSSTMQRRKAKADASWVVIFGAPQASNHARACKGVTAHASTPLATLWSSSRVALGQVAQRTSIVQLPVLHPTPSNVRLLTRLACPRLLQDFTILN